MRLLYIYIQTWETGMAQPFILTTALHTHTNKIDKQ